MNAMGETDVIGTGGNEPVIDPVMAKIALLGNGSLLIKPDRIIRACFDAGLTSATSIVIHNDDAVFSFADGFFRTSLGARGVIAVAANVDVKSEVQFAVNQLRSGFLNFN
jgi:hypothetical protein